MEGQDFKANLDYLIHCLQKNTFYNIVIDWIVFSSKFIVWCPSSDVTVFGNRGFMEVIKVKWDYISVTLI